MHLRLAICLSALAMTEACGSSTTKPLPDAGVPDAPADAIVAGMQDTSPPVLDGPVSDVLAPGECVGDASNLGAYRYGPGCLGGIDAGTLTPTCINQTPGLLLYRAACDRREVWIWDWRTHVQKCFYEDGQLLGVQLSNDTPTFCGNQSHSIAVGDIQGCPGIQGTLVLNCDPFVDADWRPITPDAR